MEPWGFTERLRCLLAGSGGPGVRELAAGVRDASPDPGTEQQGGAPASVQVQGQPGCVSRGLSLLLFGLPGEKARGSGRLPDPKVLVPRPRRGSVVTAAPLTTFRAHKRKCKASGGGGNTCLQEKELVDTSLPAAVLREHTHACQRAALPPRNPPRLLRAPSEQKPSRGCSAPKHPEIYEAQYPPGDTRELRLIDLGDLRAPAGGALPDQPLLDCF